MSSIISFDFYPNVVPNLPLTCGHFPHVTAFSGITGGKRNGSVKSLLCHCQNLTKTTTIFAYDRFNTLMRLEYV